MARGVSPVRRGQHAPPQAPCRTGAGGKAFLCLTVEVAGAEPPPSQRVEREPFDYKSNKKT